MVILRQKYTPVRFTLALVIVRTLCVCVPFDKVVVFIPTLSSAIPPSLIQEILGAGKSTAEQERVAVTPTEITVDTGCSKKKALTVGKVRKKHRNKCISHKET